MRMGLRSLAEWGAVLATFQAFLTFLPNAGAPAVIARYALWIVMGVGFLWWIGRAGMDAGHALGQALRPPP